MQIVIYIYMYISTHTQTKTHTHTHTHDLRSVEGGFFRALLQVHRGSLDEAERTLDGTRVALELELTPLLAEGYERAYPAVVKAQQIAELEEVIWYKRIHAQKSDHTPGSLQSDRDDRNSPLDVYVSPSTYMCNNNTPLLNQTLRSSSLDENRIYMNQVLGTTPESLGGQTTISIPCSIRTLRTTSSSATTTTFGVHEACLDKDHLRRVWYTRLRAMQRDADAWQNCLSVHSLVLTPQEHKAAWLKFASVCRLNERHNLCKKSIDMLMVNYEEDAEVSGVRSETTNSHNYYNSYGSSGRFSREKFAGNMDDKDCGPLLLRRRTVSMDDDVCMRADSDAKVSLAWLKHRWALGHKDTRVINTLDAVINANVGDAHTLARCCVKKGLWTLEVNDWALNDSIYPCVHSAFQRATELDSGWCNAWHQLAFFNFESIAFYEKQNRPALARAHIIPAIECFFRSISLEKSHHQLQDVLRLLTLWFKYGEDMHVANAIDDAVNHLSIDTWLEVVPQIIARINLADARARMAVHDLLYCIGREHPQVLIYPLTVAGKSSDPVRMEAAQSVMARMSAHYPDLVKQAVMVSEELVRVSVLWHEIWAAGLDEASKLLREMHDTSGMRDALEQLHELVRGGPVTSLDAEFVQVAKRDIDEAEAHLYKWVESESDEELALAWEYYLKIFRICHRMKETMRTIHLAQASPRLLRCKDLELAIPVCVHVYVYVYVCMYACMHVCMYVWMPMLMCKDPELVLPVCM
jgi:hypothetical protein